MHVGTENCGAVGKTAAQVATVVQTGAGGCYEGEEGKLASPSDHGNLRIRARGGDARGGGRGPAAAWLATGVERH
jgi:hypothetical protein